MLFFALSGLINALSSTFVKKFDKFFWVCYRKDRTQKHFDK